MGRTRLFESGQDTTASLDTEKSIFSKTYATMDEGTHLAYCNVLRVQV